MGCAASAETTENRRIQTEQAKAQTQQAQILKILLLGTGDSGKTTLRKQMRCIYGEGFPLPTKKQIGPVVVGNLIDGTKDIIAALPHLGLALPPAAETIAKELSDLNQNPQVLTQELSDKIKTLLETDVFKTAVGKRSEYQLQDCWLDFSKALLKTPGWGQEGWVPTTEECVSVRVRTSGIVEETFVIEGATFNVFDVGGQRAERRKWIHSFDNVTAVLFVTAISEYDQVLFEDRAKNRLDEAFTLFEEICNSRWFANVPVILFLNKKDLFEQKFLVNKVPLNISGLFPTAPESNTDMKGAIDWITQQFLKKKKNPQKPVYTYLTTATDQGNIKYVFDVCRSIIVKRNLITSGFIYQPTSKS